MGIVPERLRGTFVACVGGFAETTHSVLGRCTSGPAPRRTADLDVYIVNGLAMLVCPYWPLRRLVDPARPPAWGVRHGPMGGNSMARFDILLPAALAAWSPDIIFALVGGYLMLKVPT